MLWKPPASFSTCAPGATTGEDTGRFACDGALHIAPRELPWLDRIQQAVETTPDTEAEFIGAMLAEVDRPSSWPATTGLVNHPKSVAAGGA